MEDRLSAPHDSPAAHKLTTNNIEERRRRICGPKSKFGCATCKKRHLKCDETKPLCIRCRTDGWSCDGYQSMKYQKPSIPSYQPISETPTNLSRTLLNNFTGTSEEHRSFHFFVNRTAADLGIFSDSNLWSIDVCRVAFTEKPVQHALIAVAALHEDHIREIELQAPKNQMFSLSQYNKAINALNNRLANDKSNYEITVVTCLLFIYLEFLRGSPQTALAHFHSGLKLLPHVKKQVKEEPNISPVEAQSSTEISVDQELARTLSRFRKTTLGNDLIPLRLYGPLSNYGPLSKYTLQRPFSNLREAEECLRPLIIHAFKEVYTIYRVGRGSPEVQIAQRQEIDSRLSDWAVQIENFTTKQMPPLTSGDLQVIRMLRILNLMATIWNKVATTLWQADYDGCLDYFERLLSFVEEVRDQNANSYKASKAGWINATSSIYDISSSSSLETANPSHQKHSDDTKTPLSIVDHSVSKRKIGIAFPLYFTAIKCRSPSLRRRALSLIPVFALESGNPGNSKFLKEVAQYAIDFEEGRCRQLVTEDMATWPTETQRIQMIYFMPIYDMKNKTQAAMFVQQPGGPGTEMKNWMVRFKL